MAKETVTELYTKLGLDISSLESDFALAGKTVDKAMSRLNHENKKIKIETDISLAGLDEGKDRLKTLDIQAASLNRQLEIQRQKLQLTAAAYREVVQAVYYATKAYVTSWSNALWRELQGTGVTVTALMPGCMQTGFAEAGGLTDTKMFSHLVDPMMVAQVGYEGMLKGKLNVISGLISWQKPLMKMAPLLPKKMMLDLVYDQQIAGSAGK